MDLRMAEARIERLEAERDRARQVARRLTEYLEGEICPCERCLTSHYARPLMEEARSYPTPPVTEQELKDRSYHNERFMGGG